MSTQMVLGQWGGPGPGAESGVLPGLVGLLSLPLTASEGDVLGEALAVAMRATLSPVGFLHHVNDDGATVEVGVCATSAGRVPTTGDRRIPIPTTGWGTPVWRGAAHVDNVARVQPSLPGFRSAVGRTHRFLGAPVLATGSGGLLLGLANKHGAYSPRDLRAADDVARAAWLVLGRLRQHRTVADDLVLLSEHVADLRAGTWRWDPQEDRVTWGEGVARLLGAESASVEPTWTALESRLEPFSRYGLRQARQELAEGQPLELELWARDSDDQPLKLHLRGRWVARPRGHGHVLHGTLADITAQDHAQRALDRATRDQLTGLTNRAGLIADLNRRIVAGHRRVEDQFAVHLLDLNRFKQVNDTHGHLIGDAVLRVAASRLKATVRRDDVVARLGGDEFVLVQTHCTTRSAVEALAARVVTALSEPMEIRGLTVAVGTSIGVAFSDPEHPNVRDLLARADDALYRAKREGLGVHVGPETVGQVHPSEPPEEIGAVTAMRGRRRTDAPLLTGQADPG